MKLEPVTKPGETNAATTKILNDGLILTDCNVIIIFLVYGQFGANQKPHSRPLFCKTYISINSNLLSYSKLKTELKNLYHSSHTITLSKSTNSAIFWE